MENEPLKLDLCVADDYHGVFLHGADWRSQRQGDVSDAPPQCSPLPVTAMLLGVTWRQGGGVGGCTAEDSNRMQCLNLIVY